MSIATDTSAETRASSAGSDHSSAHSSSTASSTASSKATLSLAEHYLIDWYPIEKLLNKEERERFVPANRDAKQMWMNLDNPVHPIFAQDRFEYAPYVEYEVLKPALQLASLLIDTPCLLDYYYAVLLSKPRAIAPADGPKYLSLFRKGSKLNAKEIARIRAALVELAPHVNFTRGIVNQGEGVTVDQMGKKITPSFAKFGETMPCTIFYSQADYDAMRQDYRLVGGKPYESGKAQDDALFHYFDWAVTMVSFGHLLSFRITCRRVIGCKLITL